MDRPVQLKCIVVDISLPRHDDSVEDQVLAEWPRPSSSHTHREYGLVRLACASIAICHAFTEERCNHIAFEHRAVVVDEPEPNILWILQAPSHHGQIPLCPQRALDVLRRIHSLFCLCHQSVADAASACGLLSCKTMLSEFLRDFMPAFEGKASSLWTNMTDLYVPMTPHRGLPLSLISGEAFRGVQSLAAALKAMQLLPARDTVGVMLAFKQAVLHTTLNADDSEALYVFASRTVIPATRAENKTTRTLHKLYSSVAEWGSVSQRALDASAWHVATGGDLEGIITYGGEPAARCGHCPLLFERRQRACRLIAWQHAGFQILALADGDAEVHAGDLAGARRQMVMLLRDLDATYTPALAPGKVSSGGFVSHVAELVRAQDKRHVPGHRYSVTDLAAGAALCAATPASKLATATSHSAQAMLSQLWTDAQQHMALDAPTPMRPADARATSDQGTTLAEAAVSATAHAEHSSPGCGEANSRAQGSEETQEASMTQTDRTDCQNKHIERDDALAAPGTPAGQQLADKQAQASTVAQQPQHLDASVQRAGASLQRQLQQRGPWGCGRMEIAAHSPGKKWVTARWGLGNELLHIDDTTTRDNNALAAVGRNVQGMVDKYFPGALGL